MLISANAPVFAHNNDLRPGPYPPSNHAVLQENYIRGAQTPLYQGKESARQPVARAIHREIPSPITTSGPYFLNTEAMREQITSPQYPNQQNRRSIYRSGLREVQNIPPSPPKSRKQRSLHKRAGNTPKSQKPATTKGGRSSMTSSTPSRHKDNFDARFVNENDKFETKSDTSGSEDNSHHETTAQDKTAQVSMSPFAAAIAAANLPPPRISDAALRAAGVTPKSQIKAPVKKQTPAKSRRRARKDEFPAGGLRVSESLRSALLAGGATELPSSASSATRPQTATADALAPAFPLANISAATSGQSRLQHQNQPRTATNDVVRISESPSRSDLDNARTNRKATRSEESRQQSSLSRNDTLNESNRSSPDAAEDPEDGDYWTGTPRGRKTANAGTPTATTTREVSSVPNKRRSSAASSPEVVHKRPRASIQLGDIHETERAFSEPPNSGAA